jgi:hypothetical protein
MMWTLFLTSLAAPTACDPREAVDRSDGGDPGDGAAAVDVVLDTAQAEGSEPAALPPAASLFLTIDNMETRDDLPTLPPDSGGFWWPLGDFGGLGNWFFGSIDGDGAPGPQGDAFSDDIVPPRGDSRRARHLKSPGAGGGTDLYAQLKHPTNGPVDLSPYLGISFWAKLNSPSHRLLVSFRDNHGGSLLTSPSIDAHFSQTLLVSEQWQRFILLFDDFHQGIMTGTGADKQFTPNAVSTIDFVVGLDGESSDLWVDDLALLCRGVCRVRSF